MYPNAKGSEQVTLLDVVNPSAQAAGAATTGWVSVADYARIMALIMVGTLGASATVDAKLQQASDSSGTGAKDITGKAITQHATGNNKQYIINLSPDELDVSNGFAYVQLSVTVGTAATGTAASLLGMVPRYGAAAQASTVNAVVG